MANVWSIRTATLLSCVGAGLMIVVSINSVDARPNYLPQFKKTYPDFKPVETAKCTVCHFGKEKKNRNDYGTSIAKALGKQKVMDNDLIKKAFEMAAGEKSSVEGKTFGDLIKEGKLPGKAPAEAN